MTRACCHDTTPASNAARVSGRAVVSSWDSASRAEAERSLTVRAQATSATTPISWASALMRLLIRRRTWPRAVVGEPGGEAHLPGGQHGLQPAPSLQDPPGTHPPGHASGSGPVDPERPSLRSANTASAAMEAIMASIESTAAPLPIPPSSCEAPTKTVKQMPYVDNLQPLAKQGRKCTFAPASRVGGKFSRRPGAPR